METVRIVLAVIMAGLLLPTVTGPLRASEVVCIRTPLKPVHHICGIIIDLSGAPIAHAKVAILKDETELAGVETGEDGKFSFEELEAGNYDFQARGIGFVTFRFPIVLVRPSKQCKRALEVKLTTGGENCSGARLVKPKEVERRLHVSP
jgi:hypothetical protein